METFLDYVVKGLVDRPDAVTIASVDRNGTTVYELRVHPTDMGKIIGRQGATINAIRALLIFGSAKRGLRCTLEVIDEEGPGPSRPREGAAEGAPAEPGDLPPRREDVEGGAAPRSASSMASRGYGGGGGRGPRRGPGGGGGGRGPRSSGGGGGGGSRGGGRGYGGGGGGSRGYGGGGGGGYGGGGMPREGHSQGGGY